jgi:alpha-beta hydrolase superfamily lysophospholipase
VALASLALVISVEKALEMILTKAERHLGFFTSGIKTTKSMHLEKDTLLEIVPVDKIYSEKQLDILQKCLDDGGPHGRFLNERHGYTHFTIDGIENGTSRNGLIVVCHGLGENTNDIQDYAQVLVKHGYAVLRYDYYGHGYSCADRDYLSLTYDVDTLIDQLEDVLTFVLDETNEKLVAIGGLSTGGLLSIKAKERWVENSPDPRFGVKKIILMTPAIFANKPFLANFADYFPRTFLLMLQHSKTLRYISGNTFIKALKDAYGYDLDTHQSIDSNEQAKEVQLAQRLLGKVKDIKGNENFLMSVLNISSYALNHKLMKSHFESFGNLLKNDEKLEVLYLWGTLDSSVPFEKFHQHIHDLEHEHSKRLIFCPLQHLGHKLFQEDRKEQTMTDRVIAFMAK